MKHEAESRANHNEVFRTVLKCQTKIEGTECLKKD